MSELPTLAIYATCVGCKFRVRIERDRAEEFELIEATALPAQKGSKRQEPFSLVFRGPPTWQLRQGTYNVEHEQTGEMPLFLVPIGAEEEGTLYEAIFN